MQDADDAIKRAGHQRRPDRGKRSRRQAHWPGHLEYFDSEDMW